MSHRTVRTPSDKELEALHEMTQQAVGRVAMRAHMVLLSTRGRSAYEIADLHEVSEVTVYKWIGRFDEEGPSGLYDREREGRPPKVDQEAEEELRRVLAAAPTEEGYDFSNWTTPRLAEHLKQRLGVDVHPETVRQALHRLRYSCTRPRRRLPVGKDYAERARAIDSALAEVGTETTVLFQDETELRRFPPLRAAWSPVGEQAEVRVPESNGKFALYGALDVLTGEVVVEDYPKGLSEHTVSFLKKVLRCTQGRVLLIWDGASWHTSGEVEAFLEAEERLEVLPLPRRSPQNNPIEDLWRALKDEVAANLERSLDALRAASHRFFERMTPKQALATAGIC